MCRACEEKQPRGGEDLCAGEKGLAPCACKGTGPALRGEEERRSPECERRGTAQCVCVWRGQTVQFWRGWETLSRGVSGERGAGSPSWLLRGALSHPLCDFTGSVTKPAPPPRPAAPAARRLPCPAGVGCGRGPPGQDAVLHAGSGLHPRAARLLVLGRLHHLLCDRRARGARGAACPLHQ